MKLDLVNEVFGRLTVTSYVGVTPGRKAVWIARCECGNDVVVKTQELQRGDTRSCGCLLSEANKLKNQARATHRRSRSAEYRSWTSMKLRCTCETNKDWPKYGGRGIQVCEEWLSSFEAFLADMGPRPAGHSLERKDFNGHYEPSNCVWATPLEQAANRRSTRLWEGKPLAHWARELGVSPCAVYKRMKDHGNIYGSNPRKPRKGKGQSVADG